MLSVLALGVIVIVWMSLGVIHSLLALGVMALILLAFLLGARELWRYQTDTDALQLALAKLNDAPETLELWLQTVPENLRHTVRKRVEDEHVGLPAPLLTPYLVGLLVMLGLLGTFIGMVDTLQGAVLALEGNTELEAVREGLTAPIRGLGLAFATSVAGISSSAILGLVSTLCRRQRLFSSRQLDAKVNTELAGFSLAQNRLHTYRALQDQAETLPKVAAQLSQLVERLDAMAGQLNQHTEQLASTLVANTEQTAEQFKVSSEQLSSQILANVEQSTSQLKLNTETLLSELREQQQGYLSAAESNYQQLKTSSEAMNSRVLASAEQSGKQLNSNTETLLSELREQQQDYLKAAENNYQQLANSVRATLETSLSESGRLAGESIQPAVTEILTAMTAKTTESQSQLNEMVQGQLQKISSLLESNAESLSQNWVQVQQAQAETNQGLLQTLAEQQSQLLAQMGEQESQRQQQLQSSMTALQESTAEQLAQLGKALEEPVTNLLAVSSETPRAAAELLEKLRQELSDSLERDNRNLKERAMLLEDLSTLSRSLSESSQAQSDALDKLLGNSESILGDLATRFDQHLSDGLQRLQELGDNLGADGAEVAAMGEVFANAVNQFSETNTALMTRLESIEQTLSQAGERSDEQMAYYVAQAREIIDVNMQSQQEIITQLQQLDRVAS